MSRIRKTTAIVSVAALLGTGGLGVAQAATSGSSATADRPAQGHGGPLPSAALGAIAKQLGVSSAQLKAAMQAARPADGGARPAGMATALATALGADVAQVREILDANRPAKRARGAAPGRAPAKPSSAKLVAALASGLKIDTATVEAALDGIEAARRAAHQAREVAMYAAVAAELNRSADAVKAAFEANRPAQPGK